jgi:hypothetical protein
MEATYQQIQETIYAIGTARQMNGEEWQRCVRGWGQENYHSEVIKKRGEKLRELQTFWENMLVEKTKNYYMNDIAKIPV